MKAVKEFYKRVLQSKILELLQKNNLSKQEEKSLDLLIAEFFDLKYGNSN